MRIGIIGPMDEEVALLQAAFTIKETQTIPLPPSWLIPSRSMRL